MSSFWQMGNTLPRTSYDVTRAGKGVKQTINNLLKHDMATGKTDF